MGFEPIGFIFPKNKPLAYTETKQINIPAGETVTVPFTKVEDLMGSTATVEVNAYVMKKELERPAADEIVPVLGTGSYFSLIEYSKGSANGMDAFGKPCLLVSLGGAVNSGNATARLLAFKTCPSFWTNYADYDTLLYVYETTSDALGLGLTLTKGWYAISTTTFAYTPFDIENNPLLFFAELFTQTEGGEGYYAADEYFYEIAPLVKERKYPVTEDNLTAEGSFMFFEGDISGFADNSGATDTEVTKVAVQYRAFYFNCVTGTIEGYRNCSLPHETIHPIDPKYLPGVCLPVVEIADITNITAEENAKLTACMGMPIVLVSAGGALVCDYSSVEGYLYLNANMGGSIISVDGIYWVFTEG